MAFHGCLIESKVPAMRGRERREMRNIVNRTVDVGVLYLELTGDL